MRNRSATTSILFICVALAASARVAAVAMDTDWVLADRLQSCNASCESAGGSCNAGPMESVMSAESMVLVAEFVDVQCQEGRIEDSNYDPQGLPSTSGGGFCFYDGSSGFPVDCSYSNIYDQRICCCGNNCPSQNSPSPSHAPSGSPTSKPTISNQPSDGPPSESPTRAPTITDWVLADRFQNCDDACDNIGGVCDAGPMDNVKSAESMLYVAQFVDIECREGRVEEAFDYDPQGLPSTGGAGFCFYDALSDVSADCTYSNLYDQRICCCGDTCPVDDPTVPSATPSGSPTTNPTLSLQPSEVPTASPTKPPSSSPSNSPSVTNWVLSDRLQNCDEACSIAGGTCNTGPMDSVRSAESVTYVAQLLNVECQQGRTEDAFDYDPQGLPSTSGVGFCYFDGSSSVAADCSYSNLYDRRICCCGNICPSDEVLDTNFASSSQGFAYVENPFFGTAENASSYQSGEYLPDDGALSIYLGGRDNSFIRGVSGGWQISFTLARDSRLLLVIDFQLEIGLDNDFHDYGLAVAQIDGKTYGINGHYWLATINGDHLGRGHIGDTGPGGSPRGPRTKAFVEVPLVHSAGTHALEIGAYLHQKKEATEFCSMTVYGVQIFYQ